MEKEKDNRLEWIKAVGMPLVTLVVSLVGGWYLTNMSKERETRESNEKLYAQLLTQREQSDTQIRKDMLNVVITNFMKDVQKADLPAQLLRLELLASNFNQSLDLAPMFKDMARQVSRASGLPASQKAELRARLDVSAGSLVAKQVDSLARRGFAKRLQLPLGEWEKGFGKPFIDEQVPLSRLLGLDRQRSGAHGATAASAAVAASRAGGEPTVRFRVELLDVNFERREVEVRLRVDFPGDSDQDVDRHFWVSQYDFPMLDNTQLPRGLRSSIVITEFFAPDRPDQNRDAALAVFYFVVFPAASASFKERQDYDDVLADMRFSGQRSEKQGERP